MTVPSVLTRFTWERSLISERGPANPTTRHVLLTLATHIGKNLKAWPSIKTLSQESRLSDRAIIAHLGIAVGEGWITRHSVQAEGGGKGWRRNVYSMAVPDSFAHAPSALPRNEGHAPSALPTPNPVTNPVSDTEGHAPDADGDARGALGGAPGDNLVVHHVHTNIVLNTPLNSKRDSNTTAASPQTPENPLFLQGENQEHAKTETPSLDAKQVNALQTWAGPLGVQKCPEESDHAWLMHVKESLHEKAKSDKSAAWYFKRIFPSERSAP